MRALPSVAHTCAFISILFAACDSDSGGGKSQTGDPEKTSYDVNVEGGQKVEGEVPAAQASQATGGASIADGQVHIFLVGQASVISAVLQTDDAHKAPGIFGITGRGPEPNFVNLTDALAGTSFESTSGSVKLTSCPQKVGDKLVGELDVTVESVTDGATKKLSGTFDLHVYAMVGTLACGTSETPDEPDPESCDGEICADGGACCPYAACIAQCELSCATQNPACQPFSADPVQCAACMAGCPDECGVSPACKTAYSALDQCGSEHGCSGLDQDAEEQCLREHCCDELGASF